MGEGCEERFSFEFLKWIWEYPKKQKPKILNRLKQLAEDKEIIILKSKGEVERFYEKIK